MNTRGTKRSRLSIEAAQEEVPDDRSVLKQYVAHLQAHCPIIQHDQISDELEASGEKLLLHLTNSVSANKSDISFGLLTGDDEISARRNEKGRITAVGRGTYEISGEPFELLAKSKFGIAKGAFMGIEFQDCILYLGHMEWDDPWCYGEGQRWKRSYPDDLRLGYESMAKALLDNLSYSVNGYTVKMAANSVLAYARTAREANKEAVRSNMVEMSELVENAANWESMMSRTDDKSNLLADMGTHLFSVIIGSKALEELISDICDAHSDLNSRQLLIFLTKKMKCLYNRHKASLRVVGANQGDLKQVPLDQVDSDQLVVLIEAPVGAKFLDVELKSKSLVYVVPSSDVQLEAKEGNDKSYRKKQFSFVRAGALQRLTDFPEAETSDNRIETQASLPVKTQLTLDDL